MQDPQLASLDEPDGSVQRGWQGHVRMTLQLHQVLFSAAMSYVVMSRACHWEKVQCCTLVLWKSLQGIMGANAAVQRSNLMWFGQEQHLVRRLKLHLHLQLLAMVALQPTPTLPGPPPLHRRLLTVSDMLGARCSAAAAQTHQCDCQHEWRTVM
jgi:hypothetical protein